MRPSSQLYLALLCMCLAACEPEEPIPLGEPGDPMFIVDPSAVGPLSFDELQVNFTAIEEPMSDDDRRCVKKAVNRLAQEFGDPAVYKPEDYDYHGGQTSNAQWQSFNKNMQRTLLAQVVITYAFMDCS